MNQTEILALMRTDLETAGFEPDRYFGSALAVPLSFTIIHIGPSEPYGVLLSDWMKKCPYQSKLVNRLYKYALVSGQGHSTLGNVVMSQVRHQASTKNLTPDEFFEWLFQAENAQSFINRLLAW